MKRGFPEFSMLYVGAGACYAVGVAIGGPIMMLLFVAGTLLGMRSQKQRERSGAGQERQSSRLALLGALVLAGIPIALLQFGILSVQSARNITASGIMVAFAIGWWDAKRKWTQT